MKRSTNVIIGSIVLAGIAFASTACSAEPDQEFMDIEADHQQMCVQMQDNGEMIRTEDANCPDENQSHAQFYPGYYYWYYLGRAHGTPPAVGQKVPAGGSLTRPASGSFAKPPASGGFGTFRASVAG